MRKMENRNNWEENSGNFTVPTFFSLQLRFRKLNRGVGRESGRKILSDSWPNLPKMRLLSLRLLPPPPLSTIVPQFLFRNPGGEREKKKAERALMEIGNRFILPGTAAVTNIRKKIFLSARRSRKKKVVLIPFPER